MNPPPPLPAAPAYKLYSSGQILLAALLGTPIPGMWMLSRNLKLLGRDKEAFQMILTGIGLTVVTFMLAFILPDRVPPLAISMPGLIVTIQIVKMKLTEPLKQHGADGGELESWGKAAALGLTGMITVFALVAAAIILFPE